ncbi:hypothetical protein FRZ06_19470 [Anoxybacterium hadale]|uniref:Uncharacterized protein n=1 Tax=Anoxybacterium hadale TaxID=3408580 RepID=A0ACD1AFU6_9FIRM|nr:hypothetical protein FRZ06_19470 [Clostridiales bacterium]
MKRTITSRILILLMIQIILPLIQIIPVFADDPAEAVLYERVIAHGGGSYKGYETTNSLEALNHSIRSGYQYIELDMELSSDGKIIMLHDWDRTALHYYGMTFDQKISFHDFLALKVHGEFEVLTFDKLVPILKAHREVRIITDTKGDNLKLLQTIASKYPEVTNQIITQIYDYDQWDGAKELGFDTIIFTLYTMDEIDTKRLSSFVKEKDIYAVAMPDYVAEKGYCTALAKEGIRVYVHPVSVYEDAMLYLKQGAWGVYSGTLLPEEFEGAERDYYLAVSENGRLRKLTDERIKGLESIVIYGLKAGETGTFYLNDSPVAASATDLLALSEGKHKLIVEIRHGKANLQNYRAGQTTGNPAESEIKLEYLLWKDSEGLRILHKKYEYRLESIKSGKDFDSIVAKSDLTDELREVMEQSLIAKKGEYLFYFQGKADTFMNGDEILPVQQNRSGNLLLPLSTAVKRLGAASVSMDNRKDISIVLGETRNLIMADTNLVRNGPWITRLNQPVVLYMNKAMAGGEFYQHIAGVTYFEEGDLILLIPGEIHPDKRSRNQMVQTAEKLF